MSSMQQNAPDATPPLAKKKKQNGDNGKTTTSINFETNLLNWAQREVNRAGSPFATVTALCNHAVAKLKEEMRAKALAERPKFKK